MPILFNSLVLQKGNLFCYCCDNILTLRPGKHNSLCPTEMNVSIQFFVGDVTIYNWKYLIITSSFVSRNILAIYFVPTKWGENIYFHYQDQVLPNLAHLSTFEIRNITFRFRSRTSATIELFYSKCFYKNAYDN